MNNWSYYIALGSFCVCVIGGQSIPCTTPNAEKATCVSLLSCLVLLEAANKDSVTMKFFEASKCPEGNFFVCCGKLGNYTQELNKTQEIGKPLNESSRDYLLRKNLLPSKVYCGMQHTDDYFYNETETSVDEFPWLVYIQIPRDYINNYYSQKESSCVGVLISPRYVLTSFDDCYLLALGGSSKEFGGRSITLTLGQHHIYKDVSCIPTRYEVDDCTRPVIRVSAYYPFFERPKSGIAILYLINKIMFSDYVRPICLPLEEDDIPKPGHTVFISGWGEELSVDGKNVTLKKRIKHTVMDNEECEHGNPVQNPICGIPFENNNRYVCPGDNGGPLMYKHNNNWIVTGIVSKTVTCDEVHPVTAKRLTPEIIDSICDIMAFYDE